jgi:transposase
MAEQAGVIGCARVAHELCGPKMTLITMTPEELSRLRIIESLPGGDLKPTHAARILNLSVRQVHRLKYRYAALGPAGLVSTMRGKASNRSTPQQIKELALRLLRTHYADFGPTFAAERLREKHGLSFAPMTVRRWMKEDGLWIDRRRRQPAVHQPRPRRECYGELIQIDGSQHYWFENRGPKCTLLVYIDDATINKLRLGAPGRKNILGAISANHDNRDNEHSFLSVM